MKALTRNRDTKCPTCPGVVGGTHYPSCSVLAEVITSRDRGTRRGRVLETDVRRSACGCPAVLVRHRGQEGHSGGCPRATWITAVDPPTVLAGEGNTGWSACYADRTVSRFHQLHSPQHPAWVTITGFVSWAEAADWLDRESPLGCTPLGVFAIHPLTSVVGAA